MATAHDQLQALVLALCRRDGLRVYGVRRPLLISPTGRGWPDLVIASPGTGRVIYRELKTGGGDTSAEQDMWLWMLGRHGDAGIWRPDDLENGRIHSELAALQSG